MNELVCQTASILHNAAAAYYCSSTVTWFVPDHLCVYMCMCVCVCVFLISISVRVEARWVVALNLNALLNAIERQLERDQGRRWKEGETDIDRTQRLKR